MNPKEIILDCGVPEETAKAFLIWHNKNRDVWAAFERIALDMIAHGMQRWGAKAIMEIVRYERAKAGKDYQVNNNYTAYYARIFAAKYPQNKNFFEFREVSGLKDAA